MNKTVLKKLTKRLEGSALLPYVKVKSVDDYFALPLAERERFGLYRKPFALPMDWINLSSGAKIGKNYQNNKGWTYWEKEIKRLYPIQWIIREWVFSWDNPVYAFYKSLYFKFSEIRGNIRRFIKPFYPRFRQASPRYKYSDIAEFSREINFALILDFWYEEILSGIVNWDDNDAHKNFYKEVKNAVKYIEKDRPKLIARSDAELTKATRKKKGTFQERYGKHHAMEEEITNKDTEILIWFMRERGMFWT